MLGWELPPYNSGGLGVACYHLAQALSRHGVSIDFVLPASARYEPVEFMRILQPVMTQPTTKVNNNPYQPLTDHIRDEQLRYRDYVDEYLASEQPEVIHSHDWLTFETGIHAKMITGAPLIAHVHSTEYERAGNSRGNPLVHQIESLGLHAADHIVAVSQATKNQIVKRYHIPASKVEVIHNSIDQFQAHTTDNQNYRYVMSLKNEGYTVIATVGRLTVQKGLDHLLDAAAKALAKHERMVFLIAGDGELRDQLVEKTADMGIADAVLFTGFIRGKAWRDIYNLADVFVMSSRSEPFGLTALEAAQHHCAVVLTNQSGVSEVFHSALRYDYWNSDRLADQLLALASTSSLQPQLAADAYNEVNRMSWSTVAETFKNRYTVLDSEFAV